MLIFRRYVLSLHVVVFNQTNMAPAVLLIELYILIICFPDSALSIVKRCLPLIAPQNLLFSDLTCMAFAFTFIAKIGASVV
jgi:hypothetical protein